MNENSFSRKFMGHIHNDRAIMYNRRQQVSENDTNSYQLPSTVNQPEEVGEEGGVGDGDDDDDVKVNVCAL